MAEPYRYAAFISYSSKDAKFARRLHRALEGYGIPSSLGKFDIVGGGKANRVYPVFRDREELSAGQLGEQIEANLKASAALVVVCSPHGAASPWVQKEIEFFASQGRHGKIFAIISDTAPLTDKNGDDYTRACFPPAFLGDALAGDKLEPLAADARSGKDGFRNAWLKIVAGMIGVSPGQIMDRDKRRRRARLASVLSGAVLTVAGLGFAYVNRDVLESVAISQLKYRPYVHSAAELSAMPAGASFQDCRSGSGDCPVMVVLPEGRFVMGSPADDPENWDADDDGIVDESPQRDVAIARFAVSRYEITFDDWRACVAGGGCRGYPEPLDAGWGRENRPVVGVSWNDAQEYVRWLSQMTRREYRLLTEAEWEYAARAPALGDAPHTRFSWGDGDPVCDAGVPNGAWFLACDPQSTAPVGSFEPNLFGLYDMHGNVFEWVEDCYSPYRQANDERGVGADVDLASCLNRVLRGGGRFSDARNIRSAVRDYAPAGERNLEFGFGFRVARTP